ncbi:MAG: phage holin family protein [Candidatus Gracilibacteria bacterium]|nr:phage holin family protein [Candidatus Gracilibacteria bacterium]
MKIFFSILLNASILFIIWYLLNNETHPNAVEVLPAGIDAWKTYLLGGVILGLLNTFVKPVLKLLGLPLFFIFPIISLLINAFLLWLLSKTINDILMLPNMKFIINGTVNFIIAVAIFTFLNILYSMLFSKK